MTMVNLPERIWNKDRSGWATYYSDGWTVYQRGGGVVHQGLSIEDATLLLDAVQDVICDVAIMVSDPLPHCHDTLSPRTFINGFTVPFGDDSTPKVADAVKRLTGIVRTFGYDPMQASWSASLRPVGAS